MKKSQTRTMLKKAKKRRTIARYLIIGGGGLLVLAVVIFFVVKSLPSTASADAGSSLEQTVVITSRDHIAEGTDPGPYSTNPPTGGHHYPSPLPAKFYEDSDVAALPVHPEGYLVHSLEHGYVIFWYNCKVLDAAGCTALKAQIKSVMDQFNGVKVIAFPWTSIQEPLVITSWGKLERFPTFDATLASNFVRRNRYQAPEPDAQ
jgi:hypothetical protein